MYQQPHIIPTITFTKEEYNQETKEIIINFNENLWLHQEMEEYRLSHRRQLPSILVKSPSGSTGSFAWPTMDGLDLVYEGKNCNLRFTWK